jgi:hypothetical protein
VSDGVGDGCKRRDDGNFADAAHPVRMAGVGDFDDDGSIIGKSRLVGIR